MVFQGSETTSAQITVHHKGADPVVLSGLTSQSVGDLVSVMTQKSLSTGSGIWSAVSKPTRGALQLLDTVVDDDWVDVVLRRGAREWHIFRGLLDEIRVTRSVGPKGATVEKITLAGRDFTKVWELTPIWFNRYSTENVAGAYVMKIFDANRAILDNNVDKNMEVFLRGFLSQLGGLGRANWEMPETLPGLRGRTLVDNFEIRSDMPLGQERQPRRTAIFPNWEVSDGNLWALAKEWSDPLFCELWADQLPEMQQVDDELELPIVNSKMVVTLRDRPFPRVGTGFNSPWFGLPLHIVPLEQIQNAETGRSGLERYNMYMVSPQILQGIFGNSPVDLNAPIWDTEDMKAHGLRRFDITTSYLPSSDEIMGLATESRVRLRDWYCLNPYFLNGTISLGRGRPDIRVGGRVRIPGDRGEANQETYYVESVQHNWDFGAGMRTSLGVTRGWEGSDESLVRALETMAARYAPALEAPLATDTGAL